MFNNLKLTVMKTNERLKKRIDYLRDYRKEQVKFSLKIGLLLGVMGFIISFFAISLYTKNLFLALGLGVLIGVGIIPSTIIWTMVSSYFKFLTSVKKLKKEIN